MKADCTATRHGDTYLAYTNWDCRCPEARRAWKRYKLQKRNGTFQPERINSVGTRRRIQALQAIGYSLEDIGQRIGVKGSGVYRYTVGDKVLKSSAERIAKVFEELALTPAPASQRSNRLRNMASWKGWAPPLAWDDIDNPRERPKGVRAVPHPERGAA